MGPDQLKYSSSEHSDQSTKPYMNMDCSSAITSRLTNSQCMPPADAEYCSRASLFGTLVNLYSQLHKDIVELGKRVNVLCSNSEKKSGFFSRSTSESDGVLSGLSKIIAAGQAQNSEILTLLKTLPLCAHTCKCQSRCQVDELKLIQEEVKFDTHDDKQHLAIEQLSQLCQIKTSVITDLQHQLEVCFICFYQFHN